MRTTWVAAALLTFGSAQAHVPEGEILLVWQWTPYYGLPEMDGDLRDWDVVWDDFWITLRTIGSDGRLVYEGSPVFYATEGGHSGMPGTEAEASDLTIRLAVAWDKRSDRLYFALHRYDDMYDRDGIGPPGLCGGDDSIEIHVDADHSGGLIYYSSQDFPDTEEGQAQRRRVTGRDAQQAHWRWPPIGDGPDAWHWMWTSSATWHDREPYSCCPDSYRLDGEHGTEATLTAEWWSVYFNPLVHDSPEKSVIAPLRESQIIGMAISICDIDEADDAGHNTVWRLGGPGAQASVRDSGALSDWYLIPGIVNTVKPGTWGQIKASLEAAGPY